jgi:hypothetical protein
MFKARHEMIALAALLVVAVVALVVFEVAHLGARCRLATSRRAKSAMAAFAKSH